MQQHPQKTQLHRAYAKEKPYTTCKITVAVAGGGGSRDDASAGDGATLGLHDDIVLSVEPVAEAFCHTHKHHTPHRKKCLRTFWVDTVTSG